MDPAARDYILNTIISNYSKDATVVISTHLIEDIEPVLDEAVFLKDGRIFAHRAVDDIRETEARASMHISGRYSNAETIVEI